MKSCDITLRGKVLNTSKYTIDYSNKILRCDLNNINYNLSYLDGWNFIIGSHCNLICGKSCNIEGGICNSISSSADTMIYLGKNSVVETGGVSILYLGSNSTAKAGMGGIFYLGNNCHLDTYHDYKKIVYNKKLKLTVRKIGHVDTVILSCDFKETL